ncbi:MAG: MYXO-CTERM sorting domain-containing protein [Myxococcota bacterium]
MRRLLSLAVALTAFAWCAQVSALPDWSEPQFVDEPIFGKGNAVASSPIVASNGTHRLVAWTRNTSAILGVRVSLDGELVDTEPFVITAQGAVGDVSVASNGDGFYVVWERELGTSEQVWGVPVAADATVGTPAPFSEPGDGGHSPGVAWNGSYYMVGWIKERGSAAVSARRADDANGPVGSLAFPVATVSTSADGLAVGSNGDGFLISWVDRNSASPLNAARISSDEIVQDVSPIAISQADTSARDTAVASDGTDYLVAWSEEGASDRDILATRVEAATGDLLNSNPISISDASGSQEHPAVVYDGSQFMVAWSDGRPMDGETPYATRVQTDGTVDDSSGVRVSNSAAGNRSEVALSADAAGTLAVWEDDRWGGGQLAGARLAADGTVEDVDGFFVSPMPNTQQRPAVAASDSGFLVVWEDSRGYETQRDIYGMRFGLDGAPLDNEPFVICEHEAVQWRPTVASNGDDYVVAWQDERESVPLLFGTRISADTGEVNQVGGVRLAAGSNPQQYAAMASNGDDYLLAWSDGFGTTERSADVRARVIDGGTQNIVQFAASTEISSVVAVQSEVSIASNGEDYAVAWSEFQDRETFKDIAARAVAADGTPLGEAEVRVVNAANDQRWSAIASDGQDYLIAWQDGRDNNPDIYAARFSADGNLFDSRPSILLSEDVKSESGVSLTFDGERYLALWSRDIPGRPTAKLMGLEVELDGTLVGPVGGTEVRAYGTEPAAVASVDRVIFAAWETSPESLGFADRLETSVGRPLEGDTGGDAGSTDVGDVGAGDSGDTDAGDTGADSDDIGMGAMDAEGDAGQLNDRASEGGCHCSSTGGSRSGFFPVLVVLFAIGLRRRRA